MIDPHDHIKPIQAFGIALIAVLVIGVVALSMTYGLLVTVLMTLVFIAGLAMVPILSFAVGSSLGPISSMLATSVFVPPLLGLNAPVIEQKKSGEYRIEETDGDLEPEPYWFRIWFVKMGITYEPDESAYGAQTAEADHIEHKATEGKTSGGKPYATSDIDRGGKEWYVELPPKADGGDSEDVIRIPIGQSLSRLRGAAGTALGEEAVSKALEEYGGDTSAVSGKLMAMLQIVFLLVGVGVGYVIFLG